VTSVHVFIDHSDLSGYEVESFPEAGISLSDGSKWWGTRVKFRKKGSRRWDSVILTDVHPFDTNAIAAGLKFVLDRKG
jgi:hypothetical protein